MLPEIVIPLVPVFVIVVLPFVSMFPEIVKPEFVSVV